MDNWGRWCGGAFGFAEEVGEAPGVAGGDVDEGAFGSEVTRGREPLFEEVAHVRAVRFV